MNKQEIRSKYQQILREAIAMMECGVESRSAFKQVANDNGIPYGKEMGLFVSWAEKELY